MTVSAYGIINEAISERTRATKASSDFQKHPPPALDSLNRVQPPSCE